MVDRAPHGMRAFQMEREYDVSGVSGTGVVLEGVPRQERNRIMLLNPSYTLLP